MKQTDCDDANVRLRKHVAGTLVSEANGSRLTHAASTLVPGGFCVV